MRSRRAALALTLALLAFLARRVLARPVQTSWQAPDGRVVAAALTARVVGELPPRVLLLHGLFNSGRYWGAAYDRLSGTEGALVAPDLLGFGRSPRPPTGYTADAHADAVAATLRELGASGPVVVGGHSAGAIVALHLAVRHPDLVAAVVAIAPPLYVSVEAARQQIGRIDPLSRVVLFDEALGRRMCTLMCRYRRTATALVRLSRPTLPAPLVEDRVAHSWSSYHETLSNLVVSVEASAWIDDIDVPVRFVAGDVDAAVHLPFLQELTRTHAHVELDVVCGGGHDLPITHPDACIAALSDQMGASRGGGR